MIPPAVLHALIAPTVSGAKYTISKLLGLEAEQTRTLNRLEAKIDASLQSSYNQGLIYLQDAINEADDRSRRHAYLQQAHFKLVEAVTNFETVDPMRSAWAAVYVTMICKINDDSAGTGRWALRAYRAAVAGVQQQCELVNRRHRHPGRQEAEGYRQRRICGWGGCCRCFLACRDTGPGWYKHIPKASH